MSWLGGLRAAPTDSEAFRRWFGNSVVVNPDGSPRVVYHGTVSPDLFDVFLPRIDQIGVHFGTRCQVDEFSVGAADYLHSYSKDRGVLAKLRPRSLPVYLSIQKLLRLEDRRHWSAIIVAKQLFELGIITRQDKNLIDALDMGYDNEKRSVVPWQQQNCDIKAVSAMIQNAGYDGIVYFNETESVCFDPRTDERIHEDSYIILRPGQVKSAIGNRGTWDGSDPNILHGWRRR